MGFSSEAIFIKPALTDEQEQQLLRSLGFKNYVYNKESSFDEADTRTRYGVYIGKVNGATYLIYEGVYSLKRDGHFSEAERVIADKFQWHEVLSIMNYEVSNSYGYHYIKNAQSIRLKEGYSPDVVSDFGPELPIEKDYYVKREIEDGQEYFFTKAYGDTEVLDRWTHDQIGGSVAFDLVKMMTGVSYNQDEIFYSKPKQFVPKDQIDQVLENFSSLDGIKHNVDIAFRGLMPLEIYDTILDKVAPTITEKGFTYDKEKYLFYKEANGLKYVIDFKPFDKGVYLLRPYLKFSIEAPRLEWYKKNFGTDVNRFGNKMTSNINLLCADFGIKDKHNQALKIDNDFNLDKTVAKIKLRLKETIFPYFDKVTGYDVIIEKNKESISKIDFLFMSGKIDEIESLIKKSVISFAHVAVDYKWNEVRINNTIADFQDRANLITTELDVTEIFNTEVLAYKLKIKSKIKPEKEVTVKNGFAKSIQKRLVYAEPQGFSKPWWKFWQK